MTRRMMCGIWVEAVTVTFPFTSTYAQLVATSMWQCETRCVRYVCSYSRTCSAPYSLIALSFACS